MLTSERNSDRQPEVSKLPSKPGVVISLELRQIAPKYSNDKFEIFDDDELDKSVAKLFRQRTTTRNCKPGPETSMFSFPVVGRCRNRSGQFL